MLILSLLEPRMASCTSFPRLPLLRNANGSVRGRSYLICRATLKALGSFITYPRSVRRAASMAFATSSASARDSASSSIFARAGEPLVNAARASAS